MAKIGDLLLAAVVIAGAYLYLKSVGKLPSFLMTTTETTAQETNSCPSCSATAQSVVAEHIFVPGIIEHEPTKITLPTEGLTEPRSFSNGTVMTNFTPAGTYVPSLEKKPLPDNLAMNVDIPYIWPSAAKQYTGGNYDVIVSDLKVGDPWLKPDRSGIMGVYKGVSPDGTPIWGLK